MTLSRSLGSDRFIFLLFTIFGMAANATTLSNVCLKGDVMDCCDNHYRVGNECVECEPGFYGQNCSIPCQTGFYGRLCNLQCNCSQLEVCHNVNGCIDTTTRTTGALSFVLTYKDYMFVSILGLLVLLTTIQIILQCFVVYRRRSENKGISTGQFQMAEDEWGNDMYIDSNTQNMEHVERHTADNEYFNHAMV